MCKDFFLIVHRSRSETLCVWPPHTGIRQRVDGSARAPSADRPLQLCMYDLCTEESRHMQWMAARMKETRCGWHTFHRCSRLCRTHSVFSVSLSLLSELHTDDCITHTPTCTHRLRLLPEGGSKQRDNGVRKKKKKTRWRSCPVSSSITILAPRLPAVSPSHPSLYPSLISRPSAHPINPHSPPHSAWAARINADWLIRAADVRRGGCAVLVTFVTKTSWGIFRWFLRIWRYARTLLLLTC